MNHTVIRRAAVQDAALLSELASATFYDTFTGTCTETDMQEFLQHFYNDAQLAVELANPEDHYYIAELNGEAAGYLRFGENEVPFHYDKQLRPLELNRLYVAKDFHGKGVAHELMQLFEDYAAANGYGLLWLGVWEYNYRAQAFYKKWAYQFNGEKHPFPIGSTPQTDEWWSKTL